MMIRQLRNSRQYITSTPRTPQVIDDSKEMKTMQGDSITTNTITTNTNTNTNTINHFHIYIMLYL